jgi:serine/threonine protein kinase
MSGLPQLTAEQIATAFPNLRNIELVGKGGQKVVFRVGIDGRSYALKFALLTEEIESDEGQFLDVAARAKREVEIMRDCNSPHIVKLGPIGLDFCDIAGQKLLYFSEEFVEGQNVKDILATGARLNPAEIVSLGTHVTSAIQELWSLGKIHRDIKPGNIIKRRGGDYVLLDAGLAFDVVGESLSAGFLVGTPPYFSPEQLYYNNRRVLDFRSDLFSLGVTLYEMSTGVHPFWTRGETSQRLFQNIQAVSPPPPSSLNAAIPLELDRIILRLLGKSPHLRYRKCEQLIKALQEIRRS